MTSLIKASHVSRVRVLYKTILRLHRGLPPELKGFGDEYVRDEFRRHKNAEGQFVPIFMNEWTNYAATLAGQLGKKTSYKVLGVPLASERFSEMSDEQVAQLFELFSEAQKSSQDGTVEPLNTSSSSHDDTGTMNSNTRKPFLPDGS